MLVYLSKKTIGTGMIFIVGILLFTISISNSSVMGSVLGFSEVLDLEVKDDFIYLADNGLKIIDATNASRPQVIGNIATHNPQWISLESDYIFLKGGDGDLTVIDISNPYNARFITELEQEGIVAIQGSLLYSIKSPNTVESGRFSVYNFSNPENPILISERSKVVDWAKDFEIIGNYGFIIGGEALLRILNLTDILNINVIYSYYDTSVSHHGGQHLRIHNNIAYITDFISETINSVKLVLYAINVSDPTLPELIWKIDSKDIENIWIESNFLYCTSHMKGVFVYDISNLSNPILFDSYYQISSMYNGIEVHNNKIYITGIPNLQILNNRDLGGLHNIFFQSQTINLLLLFILISFGLLSIIFFIFDFYNYSRRIELNN